MIPSMIRDWLTRISHLGADPADSDEVRLQKSLLVAGSFMFIATGAIWGVAYILLGESLAGMIPLSYAVVSFLSFVFLVLTRRYLPYRFSQLVLILFLPFLLQVALGGFVNASAVILWSFICPLGALLFAESRHASGWLLVYLFLLVLSGFLQPFVRATNNLPRNLMNVFFVLNIGTVSSIAFILLNYFIGQKNEAFQLLRQEQAKSESLLLNVLPREVAGRLKSGSRIIADSYESVSVLFADLVGFTPLSAELAPVEMVEILNDVYSHFDTLVDKYDLEKIRTIGDNYMVASGLPRIRADHAQMLARMAVEMNAYLASRPPIGDRSLSFRIGINSGPAIAGVIGTRKFHYDVWGDMVNIASRMESQGLPGRIQITSATYELIKDEFICEPHGPIPIKGRGLMETWFLVGLKVKA